MIHPRAATVFLAGLVLLCVTGPAQEQIQNREGVKAHLRVELVPARPASSTDRLEVSLSSQLVLTLTVEAARDVEIAAVPLIAASKFWRQQNTVTGWETTPLDDGRVRRRQTYRLSPWQPDETLLPLAPLRFRTPRSVEDWEHIVWKPIPVRVTTIVQQADLLSARDITGIEELPTPERAYGWPFALGGGLAVVVCCVAGWLVWWTYSRSAPTPTAEEWALQQLTRLGQHPLDTAAELESFSIRLSAVLRRYLEQRFGFHAPQQTTAEFLDTVQQSPQLAPRHRELLRELLEQCDLAKFARAQPTQDECRLAVARACAFVEETRQEPPEISTAVSRGAEGDRGGSAVLPQSPTSI